jgi:hypothetical protein
MTGTTLRGSSDHGPRTREAKVKEKAKANKKEKADAIPQRGKAKAKRRVRAAGKRLRGRLLARDT